MTNVIVAINAGSSSVKIQSYEDTPEGLSLICAMKTEGVNN